MFSDIAFDNKPIFSRVDLALFTIYHLPKFNITNEHILLVSNIRIYIYLYYNV